MKYSNTQRHYVIALTAAKMFLVRDIEERKNHNVFKSRFLCIALYIACRRGMIKEKSKTLTQQMIKARLGNSTNVHNWLIDTAKTDAEAEVYCSSTFNEIQQYRHDWVDAMIKEFSNV